MIWEEYYNKHRLHSSLHGRTPWEKYKELGHTIPSIEEVHKSYDSSKETFAIQNYKYDQEFKSAIKQKNILSTKR